jgi:hypothetical protein
MMKSTDQKFYEKLNRQYAVPGEPRTVLAECLAPQKKTMLSQLASDLEVAGRSRMNKEELAAALSQALLEPKALLRTLGVINHTERELWERLLKQPVLESNEFYPSQYMQLQDGGLIYTFWQEDTLAVVLPEEIRRVYEGLDLREFWTKWERQHLIADYIAAAANLYGACERSKLLEIFNSQNAEAATEDEVTLAGLKLMYPHQQYLIYQDYWISNYFEDDDTREELAELLELSRNKPYYIPPKTEFLRYADNVYTPTTLQFEKLKTYVSRHIVRDRELAETVADNIRLASSMEAPLDELLDEFLYLDIELSEQQIDGLLPLLVELRNNTRVWTNRGYTPVEMRSLFTPPAASLASRPMGTMLKPDFARNAAAPKVGRNDPCPCGSGKKHKKCCGAIVKE